jgi:hypothetical protein
MQPLNKKPFGKAQPHSQTGGDGASEPIYIYDRRQNSRTHVLQKGKLAFGVVDFAIDCLIHDISAGGARVRIQPGPVVPEGVILVHLRDRIAFEAGVVWRKDDGTLGLKFLARHDLEQATSPGLRALRRHCIDYSLR